MTGYDRSASFTHFRAGSTEEDAGTASWTGAAADGWPSQAPQQMGYPGQGMGNTAPPPPYVPQHDWGQSDQPPAPRPYVEPRTTYTPPPPVDHSRRIWAHLRESAIGRMAIVNSLHARNAWALRRSNPLCPYAFAFLYAFPGFGHRADYPVYEAGVATRIIKAGEEVSHLPRVLYDLASTARYFLDNGGVDPRQVPQLCQRVDDKVGPDSTFIGLGVSSLDGPYGPWKETLRRVDGEDRIPGRYYLLMMDPEATRVVVDRPAEPFERKRIRASGRIGYEQLLDEPGAEAIWEGMTNVVKVIAEGVDQLAARAAQPRSRRA